MTDSQVLQDAGAVHGHVRRVCFKTGPPGLVGAELEWLVARADDPSAVVPLDLVPDLLDGAGPLPGASRLTMEPGGQVELSSPPAPDAAGCCSALASDMAHLERTLRGAGLLLVATGLDPDRPPVRQLHEPRYDAMADYFATRPHDLGPLMMTSTAAVQVNLDAGADPDDVARRWQLLHVAGPTLSAAFANSPRHRGRPTGWKSTRQAIWLRLDPARTGPPRAGDPADSWADYALAAPVMMLRTDTGPWLAAPGFTFGDWVSGRVAGLRRPTEADLDYHLTTLFPPVRPRGWFEVRYIDAQPVRWWPVPVAVLAALLDEPSVSAAAAEACAPVADCWLEAARCGLDHPGIARAARRLFEAVVDAVEDPALRGAVGGYLEEYVARGRCPADDYPAHDAPEDAGRPTRARREKELR